MFFLYKQCIFKADKLKLKSVTCNYVTEYYLDFDEDEDKSIQLNDNLTGDESFYIIDNIFKYAIENNGFVDLEKLKLPFKQ